MTSAACVHSPAANSHESDALYPRATWECFGSAGHLIVGSDCRFHMATRVGPWWISTVGEWLPDSSSWDIYADRRTGGIPPELRGDARRNWFLRNVGYIEIGCDRKYETMVFRVEKERCDEEGCECEGSPRIGEWGELDSDAYNDARAARDGHVAMCEKWSRIDPADSARVASAWEDE
jgi:hypothetical protein